MNNKKILADVRAQYEKHWKKSNLMNSARFQKGGGTSLVLRTPIVRKISAQQFRQVRGVHKSDLFEMCDALFAAGYMTIAVDWARRKSREFEASDIETFLAWLRNYVRGWDDCDGLCAGPLGHLIAEFPWLSKRLVPLTKDKTWTVRRGAAVSLIPALRRGLLLEEAFDFADLLLMDREDLVQKGYGWMLKEATRHYPSEVLGFVMERRDRMPRTALRYAIEKLPAAQKKAAMAPP